MEKVKNLFDTTPSRAIPDYCKVVNRSEKIKIEHDIYGNSIEISGVDAAYQYLTNKKPARERWIEAEEALFLIIGILIGFFICAI